MLEKLQMLGKKGVKFSALIWAICIGTLANAQVVPALVDDFPDLDDAFKVGVVAIRQYIIDIAIIAVAILIVITTIFLIFRMFRSLVRRG